LKKDLIKRALTAALFLIVLLSGILINEYLFLGIFLVITGISQWELYNLFEKKQHYSQKKYGIFLGVVLFITSFFVAKGVIPSSGFYFTIFLIILMFIIQLYSKRETHFTCIAFTLVALIYVAIPLSTINFIAFAGINENQYTYEYVLAMFVMIWANDSGAYIFGSMLGKHKLFEKISPKKTWEGTIGGYFTALVAAYFISLWFTELNLIEWFIFATVVSVFGTYGDLVESHLKRRAGVKDSGRIMPGHGGMLDRFDSTFFAAPMIFLYLKILEYSF